LSPELSPHKKGLVLVILRYADELRKPETYLEKIEAKPDVSAVKLAVDLIEQESGKFEPQQMPNEYAQGGQHHGRAQEEYAGERAGEGPRGSSSPHGQGTRA
jgi:non-homologous end joining protein Ku